MKKIRSCQFISEWYLVFNGIFKDESCVLSVCCLPDAPLLPLLECPETNFLRLRTLREELLANLEDHSCSQCCEPKIAEWEPADKITGVNLSVYPSPCQSRCFYCGLLGSPRGIETHLCNTEKEYSRMFSLVQYCLDNGHISDDAWWQISSGEITIHPFKDRIFEIVKNRQVCFFTNGFVFDEGIANILKTNSRATINISIDAGTPDTWATIKGEDNFSIVLENLLKYHNCRPNGPPVFHLKYIVLPGVNDNFDDYRGIATFARLFNIWSLIIAADIRLGQKSKEDRQPTIDGTIRLAHYLKKQSLHYSICAGFFPEEIKHIEESVANLP